MSVVFRKLQQSVGTPAMFFISIQRTELLAVCEEQSHGSMAQRVVEWNKTLTWRHTTSIASAMTCFSRSPSSLPLPLPSQNLLVLHEPSSPSEQTSQLLCTQPAEKKKEKMCDNMIMHRENTQSLICYIRMQKHCSREHNLTTRSSISNQMFDRVTLFKHTWIATITMVPYAVLWSKIKRIACNLIPHFSVHLVSLNIHFFFYSF